MVLHMLAIGAVAVGARLYRELREERQRERNTATTVQPPTTSRQLYRELGSDELALAPSNLHDLYKQIPITGRQIRILVLQPGAFCDSLQCILETGNVDYSDYEALSYTWGTLTDTHSMIVKGVNARIGENLYHALKYLRHPVGGSPRRLWVDAVCINQDPGNSEVNEQVPMMGDIYMKARRVLVWLGESDKKSAAALAHFRSINDGTLNSNSMLQDYSLNKERWLDFGDSLLCREWFTRVWTVQEFVCAREVRFVCGTDSAPGELFGMIGLLGRSHGLQLTRSRPIMREKSSAILEDMSMIIACQQLHRSGEGMEHLGKWIVQFAHRSCKNPADKIYGFMALDKQAPINPDHSVPWQTLYQDITKYMIQRHMALDYILVGQGIGRDSSLPSWVPDLYSTSNGFQDILPRLNVHKPVFNASSSRLPSVKITDDCLDAWGRTFKKITALSPTHDDDEQCLEESRQIAYGSSYSQQHELYPCAHGHNYKQAFNHTMTMGLNFEGEKRSDWGGLSMERHPPSSFATELPTGERHRSFQLKLAQSEIKWRIARRFSLLEGGYMGLVPHQAQIGDLVVVLEGASLPMVIRHHPWRKGYNTLVGACYVHGIMDGECFDESLGNYCEVKLC